MWMALISILAVFCIAYLFFALCLYFMQHQFLYRPSKQVPYTPEDINLDFENVSFETEDGLKLSGWYVPAAGSDFTVLFCHGNGGNIMHRLDSINIFYELGLSCFIFDYRGFGNSEGEPTEQGTYLDAMAAYNWLRTKTEAENIIILGKSLGGSIASWLAAKVPARGLVLESAFTSFVDMGRRLYPYMPVRWFAKFRYSTLEHIKKIDCPVLVIHSRDDEIIPFEFGLQIYYAANEPKNFEQIQGTHNEGFLSSELHYKKIWNEWIWSLRTNKAQKSKERM